MNYMIVVRNSVSDLVSAVNCRMEANWKPQGGVFITPDGKYAQAMVLVVE